MDWLLRSSAVVVTAVATSGVVASVIDLRTRRVPNWLTGATAALGFGLAAAHVGGLSLPGAAAGGAIGLLLMLPAYVIAQTGAGDVKFIAAIGTLLGPRLTLVAFVYTAMAGGALALAAAIRRRRLRASIRSAAQLVAMGGANVADIEHPSRDNGFAYAPAIAIGALIAAIGG